MLHIYFDCSPGRNLRKRRFSHSPRLINRLDMAEHRKIRVLKALVSSQFFYFPFHFSEHVLDRVSQLFMVNLVTVDLRLRDLYHKAFLLQKLKILHQIHPIPLQHLILILQLIPNNKELLINRHNLLPYNLLNLLLRLPRQHFPLSNHLIPLLVIEFLDSHLLEADFAA